MATGEELAAREAFECEERIRLTVAATRGAFVQLAADLYRMKTEQLYRHLNYLTFEEWIASPDIDIGRRWIYELIAMHANFVVKLGATPERLREIEVSKLTEVLPAVRRGHVTLDQALADAETLSRSDMRARYSSQQSEAAAPSYSPSGSVPNTSTQYDAEREPTWVRCPTCSSRVKAEDLR